MGWGGMDIPTITEARVRAILRTCPPPLDAVIDRAKEAAEVQAATDRAAQRSENRRRKLRGVGAAASAFAGRSDAGDGPERSSAAATAASAAATPQCRHRSYNVEEQQRKARPPSQVVHGERSTSFGVSTALFNGRPGGLRAYPHGVDPSDLRTAIGSTVRMEKVNTELREARLRKYDDDVERMAHTDRLLRSTMLTQADGEKLKFGRLDAAWDGRLQYSAALHKRGQIATWNWRKGFFVLCEGLLHEFGDASLTSPLVAVWPVLGATMRKVPPSHQHFHYCFELTVHSYFVSDSVLATTEFAAESAEARQKWMAALARVSLEVSKAFQEAHPGEDAHAVAATPRRQQHQHHQQHQQHRARSPAAASSSRTRKVSARGRPVRV